MVHSSALTTQSTMCSELSVHFHQTARRHVPESSGPYLSTSFPPFTAFPEIPLTNFPPKVSSNIFLLKKDHLAY